MKKITSIYLIKLISLLLIGLFTINAGWATSMFDPEEVRVLVDTSDFEAKNIGEQMLIPIIIKTAPKWKSATIELKIEIPTEESVNINAIQIATNSFEFDQTKQAPLIVYLPIMVTEEGAFRVQGTLYITLPNGEIITPYRVTTPYFELYPITIAIFAFKGKYILYRAVEGAFDKMARYNLVQKNDKLSELIIKENNVYSNYYRGDAKKFAEALRLSNLSREEREIIESFVNKEEIKIKQEYFTKYPSLKNTTSE